MDGQNKKFMNKKEVHLRKNFIYVDDRMVRGHIGGAVNAPTAWYSGIIFGDLREMKTAGDLVPPGYDRLVNLYSVPRNEKKRHKRTKWIKAYYLQWREGYTRTMLLGDECDYFFTSALSGCSMLVRREGKQVRVSHLNLKQQGVQDTSNVKTMKEIFQLKSNFGDSKQSGVLLKSDYRGGEYSGNASLIGFRNQGGWNFWFQRAFKAQRSHTDRVVRV